MGQIYVRPARMRLIKSLSTVAVLGSMVFGVASAIVVGHAQASDAVPSRGKAAAADPLETRISDLHDKLKVTDAQAGQWEAVARTMRTNSQAIDTLVQERRKNAAKMTAIEDLRAYQDIAQAHAKGAKRFADAFETLYGTMSDDQKALADAVFRQHKQDVVTSAR